MAGDPVRLVIASPDETVVAGLRTMFADHADRVLVVDEGPADVVLHDGDAAGAQSVLQRTGALAWVPLRGGIDRLVAMVEEAAAIGSGPSPESTLSEREAQVLELIAEGLTNQQIADRVFISINSVKTYIRSAYRKIGVNSRSQAVAWGLRHGRHGR